MSMSLKYEPASEGTGGCQLSKWVNLPGGGGGSTEVGGIGLEGGGIGVA